MGSSPEALVTKSPRQAPPPSAEALVRVRPLVVMRREFRRKPGPQSRHQYPRGPTSTHVDPPVPTWTHRDRMRLARWLKHLVRSPHLYGFRPMWECPGLTRPLPGPKRVPHSRPRPRLERWPAWPGESTSSNELCRSRGGAGATGGAAPSSVCAAGRASGLSSRSGADCTSNTGKGLPLWRFKLERWLKSLPPRRHR